MHLIKAIKQKLSNSFGVYDRYQMNEFELNIFNDVTRFEYVQGSNKMVINRDEKLAELVSFNNGTDLIEILNGVNYIEVLKLNYNRNLIPSNVYNIMMNLMENNVTFMKVNKDRINANSAEFKYDLYSKFDSIILLHISNSSYVFHLKSIGISDLRPVKIEVSDEN